MRGGVAIQKREREIERVCVKSTQIESSKRIRDEDRQEDKARVRAQKGSRVHWKHGDDEKRHERLPIPKS